MMTVSNFKVTGLTTNTKLSQRALVIVAKTGPFYHNPHKQKVVSLEELWLHYEMILNSVDQPVISPSPCSSHCYTCLCFAIVGSRGQ